MSDNSNPISLFESQINTKFAPGQKLLFITGIIYTILGLLLLTLFIIALISTGSSTTFAIIQSIFSSVVPIGFGITAIILHKRKSAKLALLIIGIVLLSISGLGLIIIGPNIFTIAEFFLPLFYFIGAKINYSSN